MKQPNYLVVVLFIIYGISESMVTGLVPARLVQVPKHLTVLEGEFIIIICKAQGNPPPVVTFEEDGKALDGSKHAKISRKVESGVMVRIRVENKDSKSQFSCTASNALASVSQTIKLRVIDKNSPLPPGFPKIMTGPADKIKNMNDKVTLKCEVQADPPAKVTWIKNSKIIVEPDGNRYSTQGTGSLVIRNVGKNDNGNYECIAQNKVGLVISRSMSLNVRRVAFPAKFIDMPKKVEVSSGEGANLTCRVKGSPEPTVRWAYKEDPIRNHYKDIRGPEKSVVILRLTDITNSQDYVCIAQNKFGQVKHVLKVIVKKLPSVPTGLTTNHIESKWALIEWIPITHEPLVDSYSLAVTEKSTKSVKNSLKTKQITDIFQRDLRLDKVSNKLIYNLTGLKPYTHYQVKVMAVNNTLGSSDPSKPANFRTKEIPPTSSPRDVQAKATDKTSVRVKWQPPIQKNGRITGYKIFYHQNKDASIYRWKVFKTDETKYYLTNLIHNATYFVKVNAYNNAGDGPISEAFPILVFPGASSVPPVPQNLRAAGLKSNSIQIMWSQPDLPSGMHLKSYVLKYKPDNDSKAKLKIETINPNKTGHLISGLQPGTLYHISLAGKTTQGEGIAAQVTEKTSNEIPDKPEGISLEPINPNTIRVSWRGQPKLRNQINHYEIYWSARRSSSEMSSYQDKGTLRVDADKNNPNKIYERSLNDLTPNLFYKVEIYAVTSRGRSQPYEFPLQKTAGEIPAKPEHLRISQTRQIRRERKIFAEIQLGWNQPRKSYGKILGYRVSITLIGPPSVVNEIGKVTIFRNVSRNTYSYTTSIKDRIQFGRHYLFRVEALNKINYGFPNERNETLAEKPPTAIPENIEIKATKGTVMISWQPPLLEYRNGVILGYEIKYYDLKLGKQNSKVETVKKHTSIKLSGLDFEKTYIFSMCAFNSQGCGPWSPDFLYYISRDNFPEPSNVKATGLSDSEIKVTWDYPDRSLHITKLDSQIVGFNLYISETDASPNKDKLYNDGIVSKLNQIRAHQLPNTVSRLKPMTLAVLRKYYPGIYFIRIQGILRDESVSLWSKPAKVTLQKSKYPELEITQFYCNGKRKKIQILWEMPKINKYITKFEVLIVGIRKYRDEEGQIKREMLSSRSVPLFKNQSKQHGHNYLLDRMESNTVYDVTVITEFNASSKVRMLNKTTSCVTFMTNPKRVKFPKPIPQRMKSDDVILRIYRSNEQEGIISHYYLVVGPVTKTHITTTDVKMNTTMKTTRTMRSTINDRYVVAQFTQALFENKRFADIRLGGEIANDNFNRKDWIYLKNPKLDKKSKYRAFLRACVLPEGTEEGSLQMACTSSDWSEVFSTEINRESDVFTIALVSGIVTVILLILACIGLASFVRRTHDKVSRPITNNDPYLKQPLMMQQSIGGSANQSQAHTNNISQQHNSINQNGIATSTLLQAQTSQPSFNTTAITDNNTNSLPNRHNISLSAASPIPSHLLQNGGSTVQTNNMLMSNPRCNTIGSSNPYQSPGANKNMLIQQRSLEMKQVVGVTPDLVQNALSIGTSQRPPISIHRLENHINELRINENLLFSQEYESIDPGQQFTWEHSNMEINRSKNRYANVIAYDHSRVILQSINGVPGSDYINANYVDGYKKANVYIATQGPLSNTFGDFWRMIWEQESRVIVMMTKLEERTRVKCDQYWPNKSATESYADGAITVTLTEIHELAYYTIRTFVLTSNYITNLSEASLGSNRREIKQFQFTAWPDHGVPDNPIPLLMFVNRVRTATIHNTGPLVVHCSAGVGRTGAYIAIDANLERLRHEMSLDIFGQVSLMRSQRNYMVQTEEQYVFVHEVLLDSVRSGYTEIQASEIPNHVQALLRGGSQHIPGGPHGRILSIEMEFQKLSQLKTSNQQLISSSSQNHQPITSLHSPSTTNQNTLRCTSANLPINKLKNRLVNILPYEFNRVCLQPIRGCEGSDYINASFIDGYYNPQAYIATQAPLLETVEDFWRMIWEQNSTIIVMLTKLKEMGREKCHRYWPSERSSRYQYFVVDPMVEYNMPNFVLQEFKVTDARDGQSRTIRQFQFTEWPEQGVPLQMGGEPFIEFIGQVHKTKEQFGQEGPITVHCSAGVGRTGVFLALSISLEKLRKEGTINLFQTVRMLRHQRANMIQTEEQYKYCYIALQDYITSFDNGPE